MKARMIQVFACVAMAAQAANAQHILPPQPESFTIWGDEEPLRFQGGRADSTGMHLLHIDGASGIRAYFPAVDLPLGTDLELIDPATGESYLMSADLLQEWGGWTPVFNGESLILAYRGSGPESETLAPMGTVQALGLFEPAQKDHRGSVDRGICGADDRRFTSPTTVARLRNPLGAGTVGICTGTLMMTGRHILTAGHCGPFNPGTVVEFDVPRGGLIWSPPESQFPLVVGTEVRDFDFTVDSSGNILTFGDDISAFEIGRNVDRQLAGTARGNYSRVSWTNPSGPMPGTAAFLGCGTHTNAALDFVMKSVAGQIASTAMQDGGEFWLYNVDQTGGDSGGPVIVNVPGLNRNAIVGVRSFSSASSCIGTGAYSANDVNFVQTLHAGVGGGTSLFVDPGFGPILGQGPTRFSLFDAASTFEAAYLEARGRSQPTIFVVEGTYIVSDSSASGMVIDTPVTIEAPFGPVILR